MKIAHGESSADRQEAYRKSDKSGPHEAPADAMPVKSGVCHCRNEGGEGAHVVCRRQEHELVAFEIEAELSTGVPADKWDNPIHEDREAYQWSQQDECRDSLHCIPSRNPMADPADGLSARLIGVARWDDARGSTTDASRRKSSIIDRSPHQDVGDTAFNPDIAFDGQASPADVPAFKGFRFSAVRGAQEDASYLCCKPGAIGSKGADEVVSRRAGRFHAHDRRVGHPEVAREVRRCGGKAVGAGGRTRRGTSGARTWHPDAGRHRLRRRRRHE